MLAYLVASLPDEVAAQAGYSYSDLFLRCVYNGVQCEKKYDDMLFLQKSFAVDIHYRFAEISN